MEGEGGVLRSLAPRVGERGLVAPSHSNAQTVTTNMHSLDEQDRKKGSVARRTCWALCSLEQVGQATAVLEKRMVFGVGHANLTANNARRFQ